MNPTWWGAMKSCGVFPLQVEDRSPGGTSRELNATLLGADITARENGYCINLWRMGSNGGEAVEGLQSRAQSVADFHLPEPHLTSATEFFASSRRELWQS